jgi:hypothetical protein
MTGEQQTQPEARVDVPLLAKGKLAHGPKTTKARRPLGPSRNSDKHRRRGRKPYPVIPFEQAMRIGQGLADFGAGHPMKRTTLLEKLSLPGSQTTKDLITASGKYGITEGAP